MEFNKLVKEIKGELKKGDEITLPDSNDVWIIGSEEADYINISTEDGRENKISKYNLGDIKRADLVFEYKTQAVKDGEMKRYKDKIKDIKERMAKYKKSSQGSDSYKKLEKELKQHQTAYEYAKRQTPYMTIY